MGFEAGLNAWKSILKPGGYIAVTEVNWLEPNPPEQLRQLWQQWYPSITNVKANKEIITNCGYSIVDCFPLPEQAWWNYYDPLKIRLQQMRDKYPNNQQVLELIKAEEKEIEIYKKYSAYYGYVFYIMRAND